MASNYHTQFGQKKVSNTSSYKHPSGTSASYKETTTAWPSPAGFTGPVGPKFNSLGYPEVKVYAAKRMADDKGKMAQFGKRTKSKKY